MKYRKILESDFEIAENKVFFDIIIFSNNFLLEKDKTNIKDKVDNWKDKNIKEQTHLFDAKTP